MSNGIVGGQGPVPPLTPAPAPPPDQQIPDPEPPGPQMEAASAALGRVIRTAERLGVRLVGAYAGAYACVVVSLGCSAVVALVLGMISAFKMPAGLLQLWLVGLAIIVLFVIAGFTSGVLMLSHERALARDKRPRLPRAAKTDLTELAIQHMKRYREIAPFTEIEEDAYFAKWNNVNTSLKDL